MCVKIASVMLRNMPKRGNKAAAQKFIHEEIFGGDPKIKAMFPSVLGVLGNTVHVTFKIILVGERINKYAPFRQTDVGYIILSEDDAGKFTIEHAVLATDIMDKAQINKDKANTFEKVSAAKIDNGSIVAPATTAAGAMPKSPKSKATKQKKVAMVVGAPIP